MWRLGSLRASPGARHYDTRRAADQLDHCLSTGVDVYRHSPRHASEPVVAYLVGLQKGGNDGTNRDAGVAVGGGGRLGGGVAIRNPGFAGDRGVARGADLVEQHLLTPSSR